ncbi:MAG: hypothetical protein ACXWZF_10595 [Actinomycetota bacterium]
MGSVPTASAEWPGVTATLPQRRVLATLPYRFHYLISDQVNGDWATYESCRERRGEFSACQVFLYDISAGGDAVRVANPGVQQDAGAVSADGTV